MDDTVKASADIVKYEVGGREVTLMDTGDAQQRIMERVLESPSVEAIFDAAETTTADEVDGRPFKLEGVEFFKSDFEEGVGVYAIMQVNFVDTGQRSVLTCGGANVLAQLMALDKFGMPPFPLALKRKTKPTSNGFYPLWLHRA